MKKSIFIYGAGGLGRELIGLIAAIPEWTVDGFFDDGISAGTLVKGIPVRGGIEAVRNLLPPANVILAFGDPVVRQKVGVRLKEIPGIQFPTLVHPRAILQDQGSIQIGKGSVILAGCILTTDIQIGDHVLINLNCTVGHNGVLGDYASIMPGANLAGQVTIGAAALVGSGANVLNGITVGSRSRVGAGAVVTKDVPPEVVVIGVPAKVRQE